MRIALLLLSVLALWANAVQAQLDATISSAIVEHEAAATPPLLTRTALLERPALEQASLARDGRHVAFMTRDRLEATLQLLDTTTLATTELLRSVQLKGFGWSEASDSLVLDMGSAIGVLHLERPDAPSWVVTQDSANPYRFLGSDRTDAGGILVARRQADNSQLLQRIGFDGATHDIATTTDYIGQAMLTADGSAAFVVTSSAEQRSVLHIRNNETTLLLTCPIVSDCTLLSHDPRTDTLWLTSYHDSDLRQLTAVSTSGSSIVNVHHDPQDTVDVFAVTLSDQVPRVVQYRNGNVQNHALDDIAREALDEIRAQLPGSNLSFTTDNDAAWWLVREENSDQSQPRYHLFNHRNDAFTEILAATHKASIPEPAQLSRKLPIDYSASDGLRLHGYLTLPKGVTIATAPLVVLPHGGPWARVHDNYDGFTQLLANRGYIVFEPNFRASTGYGLNYILSANRDFGNGRVQQDITDGVHYLLQHGIGDPARVAMVGMSFGGFSVLSGLAFTPELYKVGVAIVPPADMGNALRQLLNRPRAAEQDPAIAGQLTTLLGNVGDPADVERLYQKSPHASLDTINAPLLLIAGADDDRVSIGHVKNYSLGLVNLGKQVSLLIDEDEGHGFQDGRALEAVYYLTERMLGEYLQGRVQAIDDPRMAHYIERRLLLRAGFLETFGELSTTDH